MENEVTYELKSPFEYAVKGDVQEAAFITLSAPNYKQMDRFIPIKQAFTSAVTEISESAVAKTAVGDAPEDHEMTSKAVMQVMYAWSGDMVGVLLHAEQLFKSGAALVDGETKLTSDLMAKMALSDFEFMVGDYIAAFIARSLLDGQ